MAVDLFLADWRNYNWYTWARLAVIDDAMGHPPSCREQLYEFEFKIQCEY